MTQFPEWEFDPSKLLVKVDVNVNADLENIDDVVGEVKAIMSKMECGCGREGEIELALREALANAIIHGAKRDPKKEVACTIICEEERGMLIVVRDPGTGFDPASLANPTRGENVFSDHGRGIFMINQLVDSVTYREGGTEIRMRVRGGKPSDESATFWKS
jgi:serine/threonine-protein kinase RsbW